MAPPSFDDLAGPAAEVLEEGYQTEGFQLGAKRTTSFQKASLNSTIDFEGGKRGTGGTIAWSFPKFGLEGLALDKLEVDKEGKVSMEVSVGEGLHKIQGLTVSASSEAEDASSASIGVCYEAMSNTQWKADIKPADAKDFNVEMTRSLGESVTFGKRLTGEAKGVPDVGLSLAKGPLFASLTATCRFSTFNASGCYSANDSLKLAGTFQQGGGESGNFSVGAAYQLREGTSLRAKIEQDRAVSIAIQHELSAGVSFNTGTKLDLKKNLSYGFAVNIE